MSVRHTVRWACTDGLLLAAVRRRARAGIPDARLFCDPAAQDDPAAFHRRMRVDRPFGPAAYPDALVTVHHAVARRVLAGADFGQVAGRRDALPAAARLALRLVGPPPVDGPLVPPSMLVVDGPEHDRLRRLVAPAFSARAVAALRPEIADLAAQLLDELAERAVGGASVDLVEHYTARLPLAVVCRILGLEPGSERTLLRWGDSVAAALDRGQRRSDHRRAERDLLDLHAWIADRVAAIRRGEAPDDGLLARMAAEVDAGGLSEHELLANAVFVIAAGFETSVNALAGGTELLLAHPEQRALLAAGPDRWAGAVDEILRCASPVTRAARRARHETEVEGVAVPAGTIVTVDLIAANRDPTVFADPHRFDVTRPDARRQLAFSVGPHHCAGSALARAEIEIGLRTLLDRFPELRIAGPREMRTTRIVRGYRRLPVVPGRDTGAGRSASVATSATSASTPTPRP
ncbi:cytochrome P450 [Actinomycetospora chiangmaiensis]|uniref:cytochrome P450 n=1 Tax=Actinomycetospora chiangmaiensis TaxID=402650 RepID=UPI000364C696|nr:cytochrome P450 [Actinomycetospora chiangmaiensis]